MMIKRLKVKNHEDRKRRNSSADHRTAQNKRAERKKGRVRQRETGRQNEMEK